MNDNVSLVPAGKLRCVISDKLRKDTPEENVRQRFARSLMSVYGYAKEDIEVEFSVKIGSSRRRVDIAIFPPETDHKQENVETVVECKKDKIKPTDKDNGVDQLKSYLSACDNSRFGVWIGSELQVWERITGAGGNRALETATDIPRFGSNAPQPLMFHELVRADDQLIQIFKRCHNYIYGNQGLQKEPAFQELLKLIFCKVEDEESSTGEMRFFVSNQDRRSELGQRNLRKTIDDLFGRVVENYPYIFDEGDSIKLEDKVLAYIVGEFQQYSLLETKADVKGAAYEQLVGANLIGDRGEYFTPRAVCQMAVRMALATFPESERLSLRVIDPTCGTGGFLREMIVAWSEIIQQGEMTKYKDTDRARSRTKTRIKKMASRFLTGIDFNPTLVRAAQMNLVMHGDGSTNILHTNSLLPSGEWPDDHEKNNVRSKVKLGTFDLVVTNPPFGANIKIDDSHILAQYEISTYGNDNSSGLTRQRGAMPPEQLFIERCMQLLKPGGRMAIVLPDSILSNPGLTWLRRWILKEARVLASIDLPAVTFEPYTGTQTSVLILQKKYPSDKKQEKHTGKMIEYQVFMSTPEAVGKDRRGNPIYVRTPEGEVVEFDSLPDPVTGQVYKEKMEFNQLPRVADMFIEWLDQNDRMEWINNE